MGNSVGLCQCNDVENEETAATSVVLPSGLEAFADESKGKEQSVSLEAAEPQPVIAEASTEPQTGKDPAGDASTEKVAEPQPVKEAEAGALTANPALLVVTFETKGTGKETELVFKTQPLPFECKPESKGCCAGKAGRVEVTKVDPKKAQQHYDLKLGMLIKKLDGVELSKDLDWPEFQNTLASKTKELAAELKEAPNEEASMKTTEEKTTEEPKESPKPITTEASKEATADAANKETTEAPKEAAAEDSKEATATEASSAAAAKEDSKEATAEATKKETTEAPKEAAAEGSKDATATEASSAAAAKEDSKEATAEAKDETNAGEASKQAATEVPKETA